MFGIFKKPDPQKSTDQCLELWNILTDKDQRLCAVNILKYARGLAEECNTPSEVMTRLAKIKQSEISRYGIKDHMHPALMQVQILNDYVFTCAAMPNNHGYTASALLRITLALNNDERDELREYLDRLTSNPIPKGRLNNHGNSSANYVEQQKIIVSCPICSQKCRIPAKKALEVKCPKCDYKWVVEG